MSMGVRGLAVLVLSAVLTLGSAGVACAQTDRLVILTSFSEKVVGPLVDSFSKTNPHLSVTVLNRNTASAISFVRETASADVDVIWASSLDAFELLKREGRLRRIDFPLPDVPDTIGGYPINDPDHYFIGFALSGYGLMWNTEYLARYGLQAPRAWSDLADPSYLGHVGITAPSRSGTTHLMVELILQNQGWDQGWATLLRIAGNLATVTARSYGVMEGVKAGRFGVGPVIDFFGLSSATMGAPVKFTYPDTTVVLPANAAIICGGRNPEAARRFIEFLLSMEGQSLLLRSDIRRLPVRPEVYDQAPADYPNPFRDRMGQEGTTFDASLSQRRYNLVNSLFDHLITYRARGLKRVWRSIREAEALLAVHDDGNARGWIAEARNLLTRIPVSEEQSISASYTAQFSSRHRGIAPPPEQGRIEIEWREQLASELKKAQYLADQALVRLDELTRESDSAHQDIRP